MIANYENARNSRLYCGNYISIFVTIVRKRYKCAINARCFSGKGKGIKRQTGITQSVMERFFLTVVAAFERTCNSRWINLRVDLAVTA